MLRAKHLIGLPVINVATGEQIASVRSLVLSLADGHLQALVVSKGTIFREPHVFKFEQLHAIGQDAVLVKSGEETHPLPHVLAQVPYASMDGKLFGRQVLTAAGKVLGALDDVVFNPLDGTISHYMLTDGLLQSLLQGPAIMLAPQQPVVGAGHVIVPDEPASSDNRLTMQMDPPEWF